MFLGLIPLAYSPLLGRSVKTPYRNELSPYYLLLHAVLNSIQLTAALLIVAFAKPKHGESILRQINDGRLHGLRALGSILGLLQITAQWACSMVMSVTHHV